MIEDVRKFLLPPGGWLSKISGSWVVGALFAVLALAGSRGAWIAFPMTAPVPAGQIFLAPLPLAAGPLFALLVGLALLALIWSRGLSCALLLCALALLWRIPLEAATHHPQWLNDYLVQTSDRLELTQFLTTHYTLNLSPEPALVPMDRIEDTDDQLRAGWLMLARPWYLSVAVCLGLLLVVASGWRSRRRLAWLGGISLVLVVAVLVPPLWGLERTQRWSDDGDRHLVAGNGAAALTAYEAAYAGNAGLVASPPFWERVAMAYAQASGGRHPYARLIGPFGLWLQRPQPSETAPYEAG